MSKSRQKTHMQKNMLTPLIITSVTDGGRRWCFHLSVCLFVTCENRRFFKYIGWSCVLFCLIVCLLWWKLKIFITYQSVSMVCLFVCECDNSRTLSAIFVKLHQRIPKEKREAVSGFWLYMWKVLVTVTSFAWFLSYFSGYLPSDTFLFVCALTLSCSARLPSQCAHWNAAMVVLHLGPFVCLFITWQIFFFFLPTVGL